MEMSLNESDPAARITHYEPGLITINQQSYDHSLLLSPHTLENVAVCSLNDLDEPLRQKMLDLAPQVLLIGTENDNNFSLHPPITTWFSQHKVGIEIMSTASACRTFNLLLSEGRDVVALLMLSKQDDNT